MHERHRLEYAWFICQVVCYWWVIRCMMEAGRGGELESSDGTIGEGPFMHVEEFGLDFFGNG